MDEASALQFRKHKQFGYCANKCDTQVGRKPDYGKKVAKWDSFIIGYPIGSFCDKCKRDMEETWNRSWMHPQRSTSKAQRSSSGSKRKA